MEPKEPKNSDVGKPIRMAPAEAEEQLRTFIGGASGSGVTMLMGWILLEAVRSLVDAASRGQGKGDGATG